MSSKPDILIVDDDPVILKMVKGTLQADYNVLISNGFNETFEILRDADVQLIILDIMMPEVSGHELCAQIKQNSFYKHIPIVMLSSKGGSASRTTSYTLGAINHLKKPVRPAELRALVKNLVIKVEGTRIIYKDIELDTQKGLVYCGKEKVHFTHSEFLILKTFISSPENIFSREQLLGVLKNSDFNISDRVIDTHISNIRKKINTSKVIIKTVISQGYKLI